MMKTRVPFGIILGPLMILLCVSTLFFKGVVVRWPLTFLIIAAIPFCWQWRWSALVVFLSGMITYVAMVYQKAPLNEILWFSGFSLSLVLAFATTLLSWEESEKEPVSVPPPGSPCETQSVSPCETQSLEVAPAKKIRIRSRARMRPRKCDEFMKLIRQGQAQEIADNKVPSLEDHIQALTHSLNEMRLANQEYANVLYAEHTQYETLKSEKEMIAEDLHAAELTVQEVRAKQHLLEQELIAKQREIITLTEQQASYQQIIQGLKSDCERIKNEQDVLLTNSQAAHQAEVKLLQEQLETHGYEQDQIGKLKKNTRSIESMYVQLKKQFEEKSKILDDTRRELFQTNERLLVLEREKQENCLYGEDPGIVKTLLETQSALEEEIESLNDLVAALST